MLDQSRDNSLEAALTHSSRIALVTGSSSGIGRTIALRLAKGGYSTYITSKSNVDGGMRTAADITAAGGQATYVRADLTDDNDVRALFGVIESTSGNLHVLVNNAGHTVPTDFASASAEHWLEQYRTNFVSAALCSQQAAKLMLGSGGGTIVNVASIRGLPEGVRPGIMAYGAAKAALIHLTRALARQLAPTIRVNAVAPGVVETPYLETIEAAVIDQWRASIPLGRFLTTDEVADAVLFLMHAEGMTGEILVLDCGATL